MAFWIFCVIFNVLLLLKLFGVCDISWLVVVSPLLIGAAFEFMIILGGILLFQRLKKKTKEKYEKF